MTLEFQDSFCPAGFLAEVMVEAGHFYDCILSVIFYINMYLGNSDWYPQTPDIMIIRKSSMFLPQ